MAPLNRAMAAIGVKLGQRCPILLAKTVLNKTEITEMIARNRINFLEPVFISDVCIAFLFIVAKI